MLKLNGLKNLIALLTLALGSSALTGCSLTMFGSGEDREVKENKSYRKSNPVCSQVNFAKPELDTESLRKLLDCLNANQALDPLHRLVKQLPDSKVAPLADLLNRHLLKNPKLLFQLEQSHAILGGRGTLDETLRQLGALIENEEFVASGIALLKDGYFNDRNRADHRILKALERLSTKITPENASLALDSGLALAGSKAFPSLIARFRGPSPAGRPLREISDLLLEHLQDQQDQNHVEVVRELLEALTRGDLFLALDQVLGDSPEELRAGIPRLSAVLKAMADDDAIILKDITTLFHYARIKIHCLSGGTSVEDPALFMIGELLRHKNDPATFLKKGNVLTLAAMSPFCAMPQELSKNYGALIRLADAQALLPAVGLIEAFDRSDASGDKPLLKLLVNLLSDTGSANKTGIKRLIPLVAELHDRDVWDDLLLVATLLRPEHRQTIAETVRFFLEPTEELGGRNLFEVFSETALRTSPDHFYRFIASLSRFTESQQAILLPALTALREAYHSNNVHPVIELARSVLAEASANEALFTTLFEVSEMPEFRDSIRMLSDMSKDGRLKELMTVVFTLFHKFAAENAMPITPGSAPVFTPKVRHDYSAADLIPFDGQAPLPSNASPACREIDLTLPLNDLTNPALQAQLDHVLACSNSDGQHKDLEETLRWIRDERTENGESYYDLTVRTLQETGLTGPQNAFIVGSFIRAFDDGPAGSGGRVFRLLDALPWWVGPRGGSQPLRPLLELLQPVMTPEGRQTLSRLEQFAAEKILRRANFTTLFGYARKLLDAPVPSPAPSPLPASYDLDLLAGEVVANECKSASTHDPKKRAQELVREYENAVNNGELFEGRPRTQWDVATLKERVTPFLDALADPEQPAQGHTLPEALVRFLGYFSLKPGEAPSRTAHFTPETLRRYFHERSNDAHPITYLYPNEKNPRVRLINSMDALEMVLINADMVVPMLGKNFGLQFTAEIGEAWGDEAPSIWPEEIRSKFKKKKPKTLRQAIDKIHKTFRFFLALAGDPKLPKCKSATWASRKHPHEAPPKRLLTPDELTEQEQLEFAEEIAEYKAEGMESWAWLNKLVDVRETRRVLFNINQIIQVLYDNLPGSGHPHADGNKILRDLFFEFYYSTPEEFRSPKALKRNNLRHAITIVKLGAGRQVSRLFRNLPVEDPSLDDFFKGAVSATKSARAVSVIQQLTAPAGQELIWKTVEEFFKLLDTAQPDEVHTMKQLGFYAVAAGEQLGITAASVDALDAVLGTHLPYLTAHPERLGKIARTRALADLFMKIQVDSDNAGKQALSELLIEAMSPPLAVSAVALLAGIDNSPSALAAWDEFIRRKDEILAAPGYHTLNIKQALDPILDFLEERTPNAQGSAAARRLRVHLASQLEAGTLDQFFLLARKNPAQFYRLLEALDQEIRNGELKDFLRLIRRALPDAR